MLNATDQSSIITAQFEAALQTVKYNNTSETPDNTDRQIKFTVTDKASTAGESAESSIDIRIVKVNAIDDKPVIDMDNPSGTDQPYTGNNNTIDTTDKTVTFNEVQGADTAANAQAFGAVISRPRFRSEVCDGFSKCADVKSGDQLLLAGVALDMSQQQVLRLYPLRKAFSVSIAVAGDPAVSTLTMQSLGSNNQAEAKPVADFNDLLATLSFNNTSDNPDESAPCIHIGCNGCDRCGTSTDS